MSLSRITFPLSVLAFVSAVVINLDGTNSVEKRRAEMRTTLMLGAATGSQATAEAPSAAQDTVIYPAYGFKARLSKEELEQTFIIEDETDSTDTTEFRLSPRDSLKALLDSTLWDKLDSIYLADSIARAKEKFDAWYASLDPKERKKYDKEQLVKRKMEEADSLREAKQKLKDERDSILAETPRILETYVLPDSMYYKRIISWKVDQEFNRLDVSIPDTTYNYHYYDYPFQRNDVNSSWLGVAGSPVQSYNFFKRDSDEGIEFYTAQESWSFSPRTLPHYNTKTPYTELAYYGPLFAQDAKESDNVHVLTTQNITPEFNFSLLYDRWGGGGMLENEKTDNKTLAINGNYIGKKYTMHAGFIHNKVLRGENGGIKDLTWIRDTTVDSREVSINLHKADSKLNKNTLYLNQQYRIPFTFISKLRARRDSNYVFNADSLNRDITTAFIGHSSEFSTYTRKYTDSNFGDFYANAFYNTSSSSDSLRVMKLDNKVYLRLQPWSDDAIVSKLDLGLGYQLRNYLDSTTVRPLHHVENSLYAYGGAEGQFKGKFFWGADARLALLGYNIGDFRLAAHGSYQFFPWRRARKSPVRLSVNFESKLQEPNWYQQHINSNHFRWDNSFGKSSSTRLQGRLDIPYWKMSAEVGYALLAGNIYYDNEGIIRQNSNAMSVLSADLRKEFVLGPLHLDNKALVQFSSNPAVLPLPTVALNLRYYFQFVVQRNEENTDNVMVMQVGANAFYNTPWNAPAWNPNLGVFHNQNSELYTNGPYFDIFINVQWKRACIFLKYQNAGGGWPMEKFDYFSTHRHILTTGGGDGLKLGIFWPFYADGHSNKSVSGASGSGSRSGSGGSGGMGAGGIGAGGMGGLGGGSQSGGIPSGMRRATNR